MQVKDVMTAGCECINPESTIQEAAHRMQELNVGALPLCATDRLVGMVTDRDIVLRAVARGADPKSTRVRDVMTPHVEYCFEDEEAADAARIMEEKQIRRLVVLNHDKRLVGIVSLGDLAVGGGDEHLVGAALEEISEPATPAP